MLPLARPCRVLLPLFVLDGHGRIAERGPHNELMAIPNGIYAGLVRAQTLGRDIDEEANAESDTTDLPLSAATLDTLAPSVG